MEQYKIAGQATMNSQKNVFSRMQISLSATTGKPAICHLPINAIGGETEHQNVLFGLTARSRDDVLWSYIELQRAEA